MIATCKSKKLTALVATLLSLLMLLSLCTVSTFAEEAEGTVESVAVTEPDSGKETTAGTAAGTTAGTSTGTDTKTETTTPKVTETDTTDESIAAAEKKDRMTRGIINLVVGGIILIALAILAIKFRDKIPGWWKALKSECGKISWCSKDKLKKNTVVVVIIIIVITVSIAILDFVFSQGMTILGNLFK